MSDPAPRRVRQMLAIGSDSPSVSRRVAGLLRSLALVDTGRDRERRLLFTGLSGEFPRKEVEQIADGWQESSS